MNPLLRLVNCLPSASKGAKKALGCRRPSTTCQPARRVGARQRPYSTFRRPRPAVLIITLVIFTIRDGGRAINCGMIHPRHDPHSA